MYFFIVAIAIAVILVRIFIGDGFILTLLQTRGIPVIVVIIATLIIKMIAVKIFIRRDTKILALDNFR